MSKLILDLYCGAGGASTGYHRAGWKVVGVDVNPQPDYPFRFHQADALEYVRDHGHLYDAIHASPPCQAYLPGNLNRPDSPKLYEATRDALNDLRLPYVIENPAARADLILCGEMFGLDVIRHRRFELGMRRIPQPIHKSHRGGVAGMRHGVWHEGPYFAVYGNGGGKGTVPQWQHAMGIDWTSNRRSIAEAIPPAYTEWIGRLL